MKKSKLQKWIQKPLRFHHQDIHEEIEHVKGSINELNDQMQVLQCRIDEFVEKANLWLSKYDNNIQQHNIGS